MANVRYSVVAALAIVFAIAVLSRANRTGSAGVWPYIQSFGYSLFAVSWIQRSLRGLEAEPSWQIFLDAFAITVVVVGEIGIRRFSRRPIHSACIPNPGKVNE